MQVTIFGASGKVGSLVVELALARGYEVVAFTHSRDLFVPNNRMRVVKGDIHDADGVAQAVQGSDAVISCLGSWHTKSKDILGSAMRVIIPAMEAQGIGRIITLTGAGASDIADTVSVGQKLAHGMMGLAAGKVLRDGEQHIELLRASKLGWTVIRSPVMTTFGGDTYKLSSKLPNLFATIPRRAVVTSIVDQLEMTEHIRMAPVIYRSGR